MSVSFSEALGLTRGLTALIGGGGKTSLLYRLARELQTCGTVLVCTSTHIWRPADLPLLRGEDPSVVRAALSSQRIVCLGTMSAKGKLTAPKLPFAQLPELADFVLVEADGARKLPGKAHLPHEPVIPENAAQTILVVGADAFSRPIRAVCHRPERWAELCDATTEDLVTPERMAQVLIREGFGTKVFVNKVETEDQRAAAETLAALLPLPVWAGSLWREEIECLS